MPKPTPNLTMYEPAAYVIRVQGAIDSNWSERLGGLHIVVVRAGNQAVAELSGQLPDQAALISVLTRLYELGLPLLSLQRVSTT